MQGRTNGNTSAAQERGVLNGIPGSTSAYHCWTLLSSTFYHVIDYIPNRPSTEFQKTTSHYPHTRVPSWALGLLSHTTCHDYAAVHWILLCVYWCIPHLSPPDPFFKAHDTGVITIAGLRSASHFPDESINMKTGWSLKTLSELSSDFNKISQRLNCHGNWKRQWSDKP